MTQRRIPSSAEIEAARTPKGGWTKEKLAEWGLPWPPPKGWKKQLHRRWMDAQIYEAVNRK